MKIAHMMVGFPGSGKSTYIKENFDISKYNIVSNNKTREDVSKKYGFTYDDTFIKVKKLEKKLNIKLEFNETLKDFEHYGKVIQLYSGRREFENLSKLNNIILSTFLSSVQFAKDDSKDVIIDMTNLNARNRKNILSNLDIKNENCIVYDFIPKHINIKDFIKICKNSSRNANLESIKEGRPKTVDANIHNSMQYIYERPALSENFNDIKNIDNSEALKIQSIEVLNDYLSIYEEVNDFEM